jgi:hypothetical protein
MIQKITCRKSKILLLLVMSIYLQACGGTRTVKIDSTPSGASVIADGRHIGTTPMQIDAEEVFPPRWYSGNYMVKGNLALQKEGCNKVIMSVDDAVLSKGINKTLDCQQDAVITEGAKQAPVVNSNAVMTEQDVEQRLNKLKKIYDKGLISKEEYQEQRLRILNQL